MSATPTMQNLRTVSTRRHQYNSGRNKLRQTRRASTASTASGHARNQIPSANARWRKRVPARLTGTINERNVLVLGPPPARDILGRLQSARLQTQQGHHSKSREHEPTLPIQLLVPLPDMKVGVRGLARALVCHSQRLVALDGVAMSNQYD